MSVRARRRAWVGTTLIAAALAAGGCQSLPGAGRGGIDLDRTMPGEIARARYAHVNAAIAALDAALSKGEASFAGIAFDIAREDGQASGVVLGTGVLRRLVETELAGSGPYRLVDADMVGGRLEYRSTRTDDHVSFTVRARDAGEPDAGSAFVVTDVFGRASLAEFARTSPPARGDRAAGALAFTGSPTLLPAARLPAGNDATVLARLDSLPAIEREREDLLGLRAMLAMRLGQDGRAGTLVERGIVRHPGSPLFFVLAKALFERADMSGESAPESLSMVMERRFDALSIGNAERTVARFMDRDRGT